MKQLIAFQYFGGKNRLARRIVPILEEIPHNIYVEVFGGSAAILLNKRPVPTEVYNDIDGRLVNFFRVLADPTKFEEFYRRVALLPVSRKLYYEMRERMNDDPDPVWRAVAFFLVARQSFGGHLGHSWGYDLTAQGGLNEHVAKWFRSLRDLPELHARFQRVVIENNDFRKVLEAWDSEETLFYCDPPYLMETRASGTYDHEMHTEDHAALVDLLLRCRGSWALSCYDHRIYEPLARAGAKKYQWRKVVDVVGRTRSGKLKGTGNVLARGFVRTETLYVMRREKKSIYHLPLFLYGLGNGNGRDGEG